MQDRVAIVTGATSGIGAATAKVLASCGAKVLVVGRSVERGQQVVGEITATGGEAAFCAADMAVASEIDDMVQTAMDRWGRLDIAFNNAGIFDRMHSFHTYEDASWDEMISVNLSGVFRCMRAELAVMMAAGTGGAIVNCASTVGHRGSQRASPSYVAAKHAVLGLTKQAAVEYAEHGIRVNAVSPGPTLTAVAQPLVDEGPDAVKAALANLNPTGVFVTPEEVARTVAFLCSDEASMINGHDIALDGGQLAKLS